MTSTTDTKTDAPVFAAGNLVISVYGDGDGSGAYTDNQASPIVLEQVSTSGTFVSQLVLPQTTTVVNGITESVISGEYGSSSEGSLELSADGHSLVIAGYGVNAQDYNTGGAAIYGDARLGQSTSIPDNGGGYTAVSRVIADIGADGTVDTSTSLFNVFNTNNPRSVATVDGSVFYISGQGVSGDTTQGIFKVADGAGTATRIDGSTDTRTLEIYNGTLYASRDSKQPKKTGTSNIASFGQALPNAATAPTVLAGISQSIKLTAAEDNSVNAGAIGTSVNLSPENFFFANATTLYVADGGNPKEGGLGDGGLQKWTLNGSTWTLDYTLSNGLGLVANTAAAGSTGLVGLTGVVVGDSVQLYATNSTINDLDQTYLYGITDTLSATTDTGESFSTLVTAAADTNIRGVSFAPTEAATACYCSGTRILTTRGEVAVEDLLAGDVAITRTGGREASGTIVWIGQRLVDTLSHPHPERVWPIRFAAGALGQGLPRRPLLVSPDHALLLDGMLIAARQLVNGASITVVKSSSAHYYHVELEQHGILLAEGAEAESYLDTGNRSQFSNGGEIVTLHPDFAREVHPLSCGELVTEAARAQPVWQRLADLAAPSACLPAAIATDRFPDLCLRLADGRILHPDMIHADGRHVFLMHAQTRTSGTVTLCSRHAAPANIRPWEDDRRQLGVAVGEIRIWTRQGGLAPQSLGLDGLLEADGWWNAETSRGNDRRWTNGNARLVFSEACLRLDIQVVAAAEYPIVAEDRRVHDVASAA